MDVKSSSEYVAFKWNNSESDTDWSWTVTKDKYYDEGLIATKGIFDGTQFTFPISAYVFNDKTNYANYRIKLGVSFDNNSLVVDDTNAYVIYTYACIKPVFYEPKDSANS